MSFFPDERRLPAELVPTQSGPLATVPCGPVELLIWDDADQDGRPTERERACVEQSGDTELRRMVTPPHSWTSAACGPHPEPRRED